MGLYTYVGPYKGAPAFQSYTKVLYYLEEYKLWACGSSLGDWNLASYPVARYHLTAESSTPELPTTGTRWSLFSGETHHVAKRVHSRCTGIATI